MGANKRFSVKLSILITIFIIISLSGCFSEWHGGDANLTIYLGGGADRDVFYPDDNTLAQLRYVIEFSGPSTFKVGPTESSERTISVSLFPGKWNITVTAYNADESVYAIGKATVEVRAGQNISKIITLKLEWKVFESIEAFRVWLRDQPENTHTSPYHAKLNVKDLGGASTSSGSLGSVLKEYSTKFVKLDLSGNNFPGIVEQAFKDCTNLVGVTIGSKVDSIGTAAFSGCTSLTSVTIPNSVTIINDSTFHSCTRLASVTIGSSVQSIGSSAFSGCTSLASVTIPKNVISVSAGVFYGCTSLTSVTFERSNTSISSSSGLGSTFVDETNTGNLLDVYHSDLGGAGTYMREPGGSTWSKAVVFNSILAFYTWIQTATENSTDNPHNVKLNVSDLGGAYNNPNSVGFILHGTTGFYRYVNLDLSGSTIKTIPYDAFHWGIYLTGITIPNSVKTIGDNAFATCSNLKRVSFTANSQVTTIGNWAFQGCDLRDIAMPDSVKTIGNNAFSNCIELVLVAFRQVTTIGDFAFSNCVKIPTVSIPNSVISIGFKTFDDCIKLTTVTFASGSNISDNNFGSSAFPEGEIGFEGYGGNSLKNAYKNASPKAGIYKRVAGSATWAKE